MTVMAASRLRRTQRGAMIHRSECAHAQRGAATPWLWAENKDDRYIARVIQSFGYKTCMHCNPIDWESL